MSQTVLALLALLTGALVPIQLAFNGQLGQALRSAYAGALYVFVVGLCAVAAVMVFSGDRWPRISDLLQVPYTAWLGGIIAAVYIVAIVYLVPRLGVGSTAVVVIAGQIMAAMILDHFGAFGATQNPITFLRLSGAALVFCGAALVKFA